MYDLITLHQIDFFIMKYAIIAAGEGSRLAKEGISVPKPLVTINGEPLIDRLIRVFMDNNAEEIIVICNDRSPLVGNHLEQIKKDGLCGKRVPLRFMVKSTPSSMHSMYEMSQWLEGGAFCLTTVDTIFREKDFSGYISAFEENIASGAVDGMMAVTDYIDDEKPLYISVDERMQITGFHDKEDGCKYISGGIYGLTEKSLLTLRRCVERGESRMRNFQRALVSDGMKLQAYPFLKILDIDHKSDIDKAEKFVRS